MSVIVVLADTHIRRGSTRRLPAAVYAALEEADLVLHAGDVVTGELLEELAGFASTLAVLGNNVELAGFASTLAVLGNNDTDLVGQLPEERLFTIEGLRIAMVHDSGARKGREARLHRRFPSADLVVFGHSHIPIDVPGLDGQRLFNPGSPTERRSQPVHTFGRLRIDDGHLVGHEIVAL